MMNVEKEPENVPSPPERKPIVLLAAESLMKGAKEVYIAHNGEVYRLQITRNGRLILKK